MKSQVAKYDTSPFSRLADDIVFDILSKVIDFKTLSFCKLVCKSFNRIVHKVDTISFNAPSDWITCEETLNKKLVALTMSSEPLHIGYVPSDDGASAFLSAIQLMTKFKNLKNLSVELPPVPSLEEGIYHRCLFKWKADISIRGVDLFVFLSPDYIYDDTKTLLHPDNYDVSENGGAPFSNLDIDKYDTADECLRSDVMVRYMMFLCFAIDFPLLEKVSITDSCKRGRMSLSGAELAEFRNGINSGFQTLDKVPRLCSQTTYLNRKSLKLPVSGFVMQNVTLYLSKKDGPALPRFDNYDRFFNVNDEDDFEDKEEAAYNEAVMKVLEWYRKKYQLI